MNPRLVFCRCCGAFVSEEAAACPRCGQPEPTPKHGDIEPWKLAAKSLALEGRTMEAVKFVRERTSLGLQEAKDLVALLLKQ